MSRLRGPLVALLLALSLSPNLPGAEGELVDGVAAVVNNEVITFSQVRELTAARERSLYAAARERGAGASMGNEELVSRVKEARLGALKDLIDRQLILQEFKKQGYKLPDRVIDERIQTIIREEFGGDRTTFIKTLEAQGYTLGKFREVEKEKIMVQVLRQKNMRADIVIPPQKIEEYYQANRAEWATPEQIKLRMLVLRGKEDDTGSSQKAVAEEIRQKVLNGAPFDRMAQMYSEDDTRDLGGDWGWIDRKTLNEELTSAAFKLKAGAVSEPLELGTSVYLLYVEARKNQAYKPLSEVRAEIEKRLIQAERQRAQERWLNSLRQKAYVKMF
jgi:parvulin-like peptidyl-prolyl isomerase